MGPRERARLLRWGERLALTQASLATQAPILALRRQLAALSGAPAEAGQCWLQHAQLCRATGQHDAAAAPVLEAAAAGVPGAALERVELLYSRGEQTRAIAELSALSEAPAPEGAPEGDAARRQRAGVLLELARWTAEAGQGARDEVTGLFQRALELQPGWESGLFRYATYLDQLMQDARTRQQAPGAGAAGAAGSRGRADDRLGGASRIKLGEDRHHLDLLPEVIGNYGRSVEAGSAHIYRALPRLLTLWFEFGATPAGDEATVPKGSPRVAAAVHERMRAFGRGLPLHAWITALPQLISRLCHPNPEVAAVTRHIIARVTEAYPQQAMWALVGVSKSAVAARRAAASAVVAAAKRAAATNDQRRAFVEVGTFTEQLVKLCNHKPAKSVVSARKEYGHLVRSMPLAVMVPCSAMTTVLLPPAGAPAPPGWRPYPEAVTVAGMDDRVQVMSSLQKPKKIALLGSDGAEYVFLAKPNDDLRKDCRMMEAAGVLNRVFAEEPASRRRTLYLRRFAVTPITEECGLVEWVPATRPMRHCIQDVNAAEGLVLDKNADNAVVRAKYVAACAGLEPEAASVPALVAWLDWTLQSHPPAFHRWFVARWPEPAAWFNARMRFTRTYAAWCMVGHVVGEWDGAALVLVLLLVPRRWISHGQRRLALTLLPLPACPACRPGRPPRREHPDGPVHRRHGAHRLCLPLRQGPHPAPARDGALPPHPKRGGRAGRGGRGGRVPAVVRGGAGRAALPLGHHPVRDGRLPARSLGGVDPAQGQGRRGGRGARAGGGRGRRQPGGARRAGHHRGPPAGDAAGGALPPLHAALGGGARAPAHPGGRQQGEPGHPVPVVRGLCCCVAALARSRAGTDRPGCRIVAGGRLGSEPGAAINQGWAGSPLERSGGSSGGSGGTRRAQRFGF